MTVDNALDPDIAALRDADGDAFRARILLAVPVVTLLRLGSEFRAICRHAAFDEGIAYLDALANAMRARRHLGIIDSVALGATRVRLLYIADVTPGRADGVDS
ncbi:MAG: hypothetical protein ABTQ31_10115 [Rhizobiaceae bacterium]